MDSWTPDLRCIYAEIAQADAVLTVSAVDYTISAIDRSNGVAALGLVETLRPQATILAADLIALGLTADALDGAGLNVSGRDWTVSAHEPLPSPRGEDDGELLLLLAQTT